METPVRIIWKQRMLNDIPAQMFPIPPRIPNINSTETFFCLVKNVPILYF